MQESQYDARMRTDPKGREKKQEKKEDLKQQYPEWLDAREAARVLSLPLSTIRRLTREGKIPFKRFTPRNTRYSREEIEKWACKQPGS